MFLHCFAPYRKKSFVFCDRSNCRLHYNAIDETISLTLQCHLLHCGTQIKNFGFFFFAKIYVQQAYIWHAIMLLQNTAKKKRFSCELASPFYNHTLFRRSTAGGNPIKLSEQYLFHMSFPTRNEKRFAGSNMLCA